MKMMMKKAEMGDHGKNMVKSSNGDGEDAWGSEVTPDTKDVPGTLEHLPAGFEKTGVKIQKRAGAPPHQGGDGDEPTKGAPPAASGGPVDLSEPGFTAPATPPQPAPAQHHRGAPQGASGPNRHEVTKKGSGHGKGKAPLAFLQGLLGR